VRNYVLRKHPSCAPFPLAWLCKQAALPLQGTQNPKGLHQRPLHSDKLTVRCGIASFGDLGPYFFEDNEGAAVSGEGSRSRRYGRTAALRLIVQPCDEEMIIIIILSIS
jgi:hypothetical protein